MKRLFVEFIWLFLISASVLWGLKEHENRRDLKDFTVVRERGDNDFLAGSAAGR